MTSSKQIRGIDEKLWFRARRRAHRQGQTMGQFINELIREKLSRKKPKNWADYVDFKTGATGLSRKK